MNRFDQRLAMAFLLRGLVVIVLVASPNLLAHAQEPTNELDLYLATQRRLLDDPKRSIEERERIALEMAATLDRAASSSTTVEGRRNRWNTAIELLDDFSRRNPSHPKARSFVTQAAVYQWAVGRTWKDQAENSPSDAKARESARRTFDEAIARLTPIADSREDADTTLVENARYRLARALTDRASLDAALSASDRGMLESALARLSPAFQQASLKAYGHLLEAEILADLSRFDEAQSSLSRAVEADPNLPVSERADLSVRIALGRNRFEEARKALGTLSDKTTLRVALELRIDLAEASRATDDRTRGEATNRAIQGVERLLKAEAPEARQALLLLSSTFDPPPAELSTDAFRRLAEGQQVRGNLVKAGQLELLGAERADALGEHQEALASRFRAAAYLFQAGRFEAIDGILEPIVVDPHGGTLRPRAGLLRVLALERRLAERPFVPVRSKYVEALEDLIDTFPEDPAAGEALWRLGQVRRLEDKTTEAAALWVRIPRGHPRWLEAQLAIADLQRSTIENAMVLGDRKAVSDAIDANRNALQRIEAAVGDGPGRVDVLLQRAELETFPDAGDPKTALEICDRLLARPLDKDRRDRARRIRVVALPALGRYVEAEQAVRSLVETSEGDGLLSLARQLDRAASTANSDLSRRRYGQILQIVASRLSRGSRTPPSSLDAEVRLLLARAELFRGDPDVARRQLTSDLDLRSALEPKLLWNLADLELQIRDFEGAATTYRRLIRTSEAGSVPWLRARYGLALALEGEGRLDDARTLLDATTTLYPSVGNSQWKREFAKLRERLMR